MLKEASLHSLDIGTFDKVEGAAFHYSQMLFLLSIANP
jgi:hypothetical protein